SMSRDTSRASRVLPTPPGPVRVSSRVSARRRFTSAFSCPRPTKLLGGTNAPIVGVFAGTNAAPVRVLAVLVALSDLHRARKRRRCTRSGGILENSDGQASWEPNAVRRGCVTNPAWRACQGADDPVTPPQHCSEPRVRQLWSGVGAADKQWAASATVLAR